jgi:hypothetical protein
MACCGTALRFYILKLSAILFLNVLQFKDKTVCHCSLLGHSLLLNTVIIDLDVAQNQHQPFIPTHISYHRDKIEKVGYKLFWSARACIRSRSNTATAKKSNLTDVVKATADL